MASKMTKAQRSPKTKKRPFLLQIRMDATEIGLIKQAATATHSQLKAAGWARDVLLSAARARLPPMPAVVPPLPATGS